MQLNYKRNSAQLSGEIGALSVVMGVPLLFLPKLNLFNIRGETAGLRIDDFILAALTMLIGAAFIYRKRAFITWVETWLIIFVASGLIACALNGGNAVYAIRIVEYFAFFYIGLNASEHVGLRTILIAFIAENAILIVLQLFHIVGSFSLGHYGFDAPMGIGSGNWEMGILLNFAWVTLAYGNLCSTAEALVIAAVVLGLHLILGAREPSATFAAFLLVYIAWKSKRNAGIMILIVPIAIVIGFASYDAVLKSVSHSRLLTRLATLSTTQYADVLGHIWRMTPARGDFVAYSSADKVQALYPNSDISLLERAEKTITAMKFYIQSSWLGWIIGTGPGRFGVAVDEGFVRMLAENGIAGLVSFFVMLYFAFRKTGAVIALIILYLASMTALDAYLAYKVMAMVFFIGGITTANNLKQTQSSIPLNEFSSLR